MKSLLSVILYLLFTFCHAQHEYKGIIVDKDENKPIEFVAIYNSRDHTMSNSDGSFQFLTGLDSVTFYRVGYKKLQLPVNLLGATVYLEKSLFELDEVVVTNAKTIYQKIKDSVTTNYLLKPHSETIFIRMLLRRNDTLVRLQDMQGKVKRKTSLYAGNLEMDKNDFEIELHHMRQLGIMKDRDNIYFEFPSLYNIYSESVRLNAMGPNFEVTEKPFEDSNNIKVEFNSGSSELSGNAYGHYIINNSDNAILSFTASVVPFYPKEVNKRPEYSKILRNKVSMYFTEDSKTELYYMNLAKRKIILEVKKKKQTDVTTFEMETIIYTTKSFGNEEVKSNVNEQKDIFKLKIPYDETFWEKQNQLLLTEEMLAFIEKVQDSNNEFKVRSNLD